MMLLARLTILFWISLVSVPACFAQLYCSIDTPLAEPGQSVRLRTWLAKPPNTKPKVEWIVTSGTINVSESGTMWKVTAPGVWEAKGALSDSKGAGCVLRLYVDRRRGGREPGHGFLQAEQRERPGYGLYSYVLLGAEPDDTTRERYLKTVESHLRLSPALERLEPLIESKDTNAIYMFVSSASEGEVTPEWVLKNYDYPRARSILRKLPGLHLHGPYLISSASPIDPKTGPVRPYLSQDLSFAPPSLAGAWYEEFLNQTAQDHYWETNKGQQFVLKLRSSIAVLALGLPDVQKGVESWMKWTK